MEQAKREPDIICDAESLVLQTIEATLNVIIKFDIKYEHMI